MAWPTSVLRRWSASRPNRLVNLAQPVWGWSVTWITAPPIRIRDQGGRLSDPRERSTANWSPARAMRSGSPAMRARNLLLMTLSCMLGCGPPSSVRLLGRLLQLSPTSPSSTVSVAVSSTSRSSDTGRRTISSRVPSSVGDRRTSSMPASSCAVVRCSTNSSSQMAALSRHLDTPHSGPGDRTGSGWGRVPGQDCADGGETGAPDHRVQGHAPTPEGRVEDSGADGRHDQGPVGRGLTGGRQPDTRSRAPRTTATTSRQWSSVIDSGIRRSHSPARTADVVCSTCSSAYRQWS